MKILAVLTLGFSSLVSFAYANSDNVYVYKKGESGQAFLTNIKENPQPFEVPDNIKYTYGLHYNEWGYAKIDSDFDDDVYKSARLFSSDGNGTIFIAYDNKDKKYQTPYITFHLSEEVDSIT